MTLDCFFVTAERFKFMRQVTCLKVIKDDSLSRSRRENMREINVLLFTACSN